MIGGFRLEVSSNGAPKIIHFNTHQPAEPGPIGDGRERTSKCSGTSGDVQARPTGGCEFKGAGYCPYPVAVAFIIVNNNYGYLDFEWKGNN